MHEGIHEDGRLTTCWGCGLAHYSPESAPPRAYHWHDLCEACLPEYEEGKAEGVRAVIAGRSDFERRSMPTIKRNGYMAGRFIQAAVQARTFKRPGDAREFVPRDPNYLRETT